MKIEKHGNQYRVRKTVDGSKIVLYFDHKPSQKEILTAFSEQDFSAEKGSFLSCAKSYIESKNNVLSPSTIKGYECVLKSAIPSSFKQKRISQITQTDIQLVINEYAKDHTPKSARNVHGFISAVFRQFRPNMKICTTLPQKREYEAYTPSEDDIRRILEEAKDKPFYHIPQIKRNEKHLLHLSGMYRLMIDKHSVDRCLFTYKKQCEKVDCSKTFGRKNTVFYYQHTRLQNKSAILADWIHNLISCESLLHIHSFLAIDYFIERCRENIAQYHISVSIQTTRHNTSVAQNSYMITQRITFFVSQIQLFLSRP